MTPLEPTPEAPLHAHKDAPDGGSEWALELPAKTPAPKAALERLAREFHTRHQELLSLSGKWRLEQTPESCRAYTLALEALVAWAIRVDTVGVH